MQLPDETHLWPSQKKSRRNRDLANVANPVLKTATLSRPVADAAEHALILELYDREHVSLRRYLVYLGIDRETAAETVQECFLKLHQHVKAGGDHRHARAWLYRVAHNLARNSQGSSRVSRTGTLADALVNGDPAAPSPTAEESLLAREEQQRLRDALRRLSEVQQRCLALRSQGLKYREIAEALSLSTSTVAEHVARGLERLKDAL